ncbi:abortive infection protein [Rubneribacter badeniensis]|uniref:Abortive infection protein n=1 Tax=Rubneribacter badeniensis TaxID=2070688 RepID=A0A2K2U6H1_9ACTN|nr:ATP-binding protein [Rubneribacter badeniensis]PNV65869.1 abortive infection protein [Rubneribacter badeniensis]
MLCQFTFDNFRSYRDETTFDMQASSIKEFRESLIIDDKDGQAFLPVSVIYGPNAGGKSNLFLAMQRMFDAVAYPIYLLSRRDDVTKDIPRPKVKGTDAFHFDDEHSQVPSDFEVYFRTKGQEFRYTLSFDSEGITAESLTRKNIGGTRTALLFERTGDEVEPGSSLKRARVNTSFNTDIPYLSFLALNYDIEFVDMAAEWLASVRFINFDFRFEELILEKTLEQEDEGVVVGILKATGINIDGFRVEGDEDDFENRRVWVRHIVNGKPYELRLNKESAGTRKMMSMAVALDDALKEGNLLVIDELDSKLHPKLLRFIVTLFQNPDINKNGAQLVFTSQDVSIMRNDVFRRDEIWFAARGKDEESSLWSLSDIHEPNGNLVNKNAAFDRQYLSGRYGADPILNRLLYWEED